MREFVVGTIIRRDGLVEIYVWSCQTRRSRDHPLRHHPGTLGTHTSMHSMMRFPRGRLVDICCPWAVMLYLFSSHKWQADTEARDGDGIVNSSLQTNSCMRPCPLASATRDP